MSYTDEQLKYINYDKRDHTKLLACAGSGKTRCIIARINNLIKNKVYDANSILMLTFSRFTRDDFLEKIKLYSGSNINNNTVKTIDKFAKQIIDSNGTVDVSLLSYKLMKFLEESPIESLKNHDILKKIQIIFIDEAQDLNDIQNRIFQALKDRLNILINMIGDPNQNIYQFRQSSDKYLTNFQATTFTLTKNFRSYLPIVEFSKHLRPFDDNDVICTKGDNACKPSMMFFENEKDLEDNIIDLLKMAQENNIDLSEFAILSPTRGRMRGGGKSHGLCFISNILYKSNIKFKQFYEESTDEANQSMEGIKYSPTKGHINILTYMGSKGLEWNYVILIDADVCLINKKSFDDEKHQHDRYLLYVACSRAINNMFIFSKCSYHKGGDNRFSTNPWFKKVPTDLYQIDDRYSSTFFFPNLTYKTISDNDNRIGKVIDKLTYYDLDELSNILDFQNRTILSQKKIFKNKYNDYETIENPSSIFLSKYSESLFQALYNIKMKRKHMRFPDIEHILDGDTVVTNLSNEVTDWFNKNKKQMTWLKFDYDNTIPQNIRDAINNSFDKTKEFKSHIVCPNGYYQHYIIGQKMWIKNLYKKYIKCNNSSQIREILFYLIVIKHSMDTQHYFHITSKGKKYEHILVDFKKMFDEIEEYVDNIEHKFITINEVVSKWNIVSNINMIDEYDQVWNVKCTGDISLKHTLHSLVTNLLYDTNRIINEDFSINNNDAISMSINFINFLKGDEICYSYKLTSGSIKRIIEILMNSRIEKKLKS
jgi:hypothetical protein